MKERKNIRNSCCLPAHRLPLPLLLLQSSLSLCLPFCIELAHSETQFQSRFPFSRSRTRPTAQPLAQLAVNIITWDAARLMMPTCPDNTLPTPHTAHSPYPAFIYGLMNGILITVSPLSAHPNDTHFSPFQLRFQISLFFCTVSPFLPPLCFSGQQGRKAEQTH